MASGWGITGQKGRCYDFWEDFRNCMTQCRDPSECNLLREDYLECLHHRKEYSRLNAVYIEKQRQLKEAARRAREAPKGAGDGHS